MYRICMSMYRMYRMYKYLYVCMCMYMYVWYVLYVLCVLVSVCICMYCMYLYWHYPYFYIHTHTYNTCTYRHMHFRVYICTVCMCAYVYLQYMQYNMLFSIHTHMHWQVHWWLFRIILIISKIKKCYLGAYSLQITCRLAHPPLGVSEYTHQEHQGLNHQAPRSLLPRWQLAQPAHRNR